MLQPANSPIIVERSAWSVSAARSHFSTHSTCSKRNQQDANQNVDSNTTAPDAKSPESIAQSNAAEVVPLRREDHGTESLTRTSIGGVGRPSDIDEVLQVEFAHP